MGTATLTEGRARLSIFPNFLYITLSNNVMLPNFLIIGAEKAATTWVYACLRKHPDVFMPDTKEVHFFNQFDSNLKERDHYRRMDLAWYERFFRKYDGEQAVGEATPMYLCDPKAPGRIKDTLPKVRLIVSLRNPMDRAYSHYWMARRKHHVHVDFDEVIREGDPRFLHRGLYFEQLQRYYSIFDENQIHVVLFDDIRKNPEVVLVDITRFLGIDDTVVHQIIILERQNKSSSYRSPWLYDFIGRWTKRFRRNRFLSPLVDLAKASGIAEQVLEANRKSADYPKMTPKQREKLYSFYCEDIEKLEALMQRPLNAWKVPEPQSHVSSKSAGPVE